MKIEDALYTNYKPSNNASFLIASKCGYICIIRLEPYVSSWDLTANGFIYVPYYREWSKQCCLSFIHELIKSFAINAFFFPVNLDLDFFKEYCLLFPLSSLRHSMCRAICCGSLSGLSSNLNEFFICPQVSWNLVRRTEVCLLSDSTSREGDCYGKLRSLTVIWSRTREIVLKENMSVFLIIDWYSWKKAERKMFYGFFINFEYWSIFCMWQLTHQIC